MSSYLSGANVIPSAFPHDIASCRDMLNVLLLVVRDGDIARMAPSSAYPNLFLGLPIWNNGAMYSMNKMPENGDPCGSRMISPCLGLVRCRSGFVPFFL